LHQHKKQILLNFSQSCDYLGCYRLCRFLEFGRLINTENGQGNTSLSFHVFCRLRDVMGDPSSTLGNICVADSWPTSKQVRSGLGVLLVAIFQNSGHVLQYTLEKYRKDECYPEDKLSPILYWLHLSP